MASIPTLGVTQWPRSLQPIHPMTRCNFSEKNSIEHKFYCQSITDYLPSETPIWRWFRVCTSSVTIPGSELDWESIANLYKDLWQILLVSPTLHQSITSTYIHIVSLIKHYVLHITLQTLTKRSLTIWLIGGSERFVGVNIQDSYGVTGSLLMILALK